MASIKEVYSLLEKLANGEGIAGIKSNLDSLNEKYTQLSKDVEEIKKDYKEIKEHGFANEDSLRNRIAKLEVSVENIKKYEIDEIREILDKQANNRTKVILNVIGGVILLLAGYVFSLIVGG